MEAELEQLYRDTVPKPGCPGTRIDSGGREWYSAGWIDYHPETVDMDELPERFGIGVRTCELSGSCESPSEVYGGYPGAGGWAGYACLECAASTAGFGIWERLAS